MIHDGPTFAASGLPDVAEKLRAFITAASLSARDGISVAEFGQLTVALMRVAIAAVDSLPADGADKKALVLEAVGLLFDAIADKCVPVMAWPLWVMIRPNVRSLVLSAASGAVEVLLPMIRGK